MEHNRSRWKTQSFKVEELLDYREMDDDTLEIRVRWFGFTAQDDSWEPVGRLFEDMPTLVQRYLISIEEQCTLARYLLQQKLHTTF